MSKIKIPEVKNQGSIGRRLVGMAAPIVGGVFGGPAGAAAGSLIGSKLNGASTQDALLQAGMSFAGEKAAGGKGAVPDAVGTEGIVGAGAGGAFSRRAESLSQNPTSVLNGGLEALSSLPVDHPIRQDLTKPLVQGLFLSQKKMFR